MSNSDQKLITARWDGKGHDKALSNTLVAYCLAPVLLTYWEHLRIFSSLLNSLDSLLTILCFLNKSLYLFFGGGKKPCHMWDLNGRKQEKHLQKRVRQKPKRLNNFMSNLAWQPPKLWTRLLVGYNRSHFLCSNRHINTIVCFLGTGLGCFSPPGGSSKLHNVAYVEPSDWKTQSHKPPPVAPWGILPCISR